MGTIGPETTVKELWYPNHWGRELYDRQDKYRSKPRNKGAPQPYYRFKATSRIAASAGGLLGSGRDCLNYGPGAYCFGGGYKPAARRCEQKAYGKLIEQVKTLPQGWGETLATRKMAYSMMLHRLSTLTVAVRRLKKGDIPGMCRALSVTERPTKSRLKKASNVWLEYHFGWEPLLGDIYTACKISQADFPVGRCRAASSEDLLQVKGAPGQASYDVVRGRVTVLLQGEYCVENSDRYLLNQLGLINPIGLAWELVPFSFVVDWFVPVGQFLGSLTDFFGVKRRNEFKTVFVQTDGSWGQWYRPQLYQDCVGEGIVESRTLGIPSPPVVPKLFRGFSPTRGATAVAILIGMLRSLG